MGYDPLDPTGLGRAYIGAVVGLTVLNLVTLAAIVASVEKLPLPDPSPPPAPRRGGRYCMT